MISRIDRYIATLFMGYFLGGLLIFVTIFLAVDSLSTIVSYKDVDASALISYYIYYIPEVMYRMLPVASVLATVFTLSNLNKTNELVALFSCGMSLIRITTPILIVALFISLAFSYLGDTVLPILTQKKNFIFYNEIKKKPGQYSTVKTDRIWYRSKNTLFNIKTLRPEANRAQGLTLYYFNDNWDLIQMITADSAEFFGDKWQLNLGSVTLFTEDNSFPLVSEFQKKIVMMGEDAGEISKTTHTADVLSHKELAGYIKRNKEAGLDTVRYEVDYHAKFGFAVTALVMVLLGIPFSVGKTRSGGIMANMGICMGLVFLYWTFYSSCLTLGYHGHLNPILAAWAPNLIISGLAIYFLLRLKK